MPRWQVIRYWTMLVVTAAAFVYAEIFFAASLCLAVLCGTVCLICFREYYKDRKLYPWKKKLSQWEFRYPIELTCDVRGYLVPGWKLHAENIRPTDAPEDFKVLFQDLTTGQEIPCDRARIETYPEGCRKLYEHFGAHLNGYRGLRDRLDLSPPEMP